MNTEIKELVAEGKVDEALEKLVAFLSSQVEKFPPLYRAAQVAQSEYNQIKERELQGLLTEEQIRLANNIAINRILEILEQLDRGFIATPQPNRRQWVWYALGGAAIALVVLFLVRNFKQEEVETPIGEIPPSVDTLQSTPVCPKFAKDNQYGIVIFNFTTLNPKDSTTDVLLVGEIDGIFARNQFKGDAVLIDQIKGPVDLSIAKEMVENCKAKMVIWGRVFDNSEIELNFYEPQFNPEQQAALDSELQAREQGNFQASIKQAALIIASRVLVTNNDNGAVAVAEEAYDAIMKDKTTSIASKSNSKKSNAASMATMTLANAHAKNRDYKKSIPLYHEILDKRPQDTTARRNLVIAEIKSNNVEVAIKNLDTLRNHQKKEDAIFLDKLGDELEKKGLTRKGAQLKKDAQILIQRERDSKNLPPKQ